MNSTRVFLGLKHISQKSVTSTLNDAALELIGFLIDEVYSFETHLDNFLLVLLLCYDLRHTENPFESCQSKLVLNKQEFSNGLDTFLYIFYLVFIK